MARRRSSAESAIGDVRIVRMRIGGSEVVVVRAPVADRHHLSDLTEAEQNVLERLLAGETNAQIAAARGTTTGTVCNQVASVFKKIGARSRSELAAMRSK
jgi:DNA-binding NarL/FixJ family response regulator